MSEVNYRVQSRRRTFVLHHNILSPCRDRVVPLWMQRLRHRFLLKLDQEEEFLPLPNLWEEPADLVASSPLTPLIHPSQPQPVRSSSLPRDAAIPPRTSQSPLRASQSPPRTSQSPLRTSQFPTRTSQSPPRTSQSSLRTSQSPTQTPQSPLRPSQSPLRTSQSPLRTSQSPLRTSQSPLRPSQSPLRTSQSPLRTSQSPLRTSQSPLRTSQSPPRVPQSPPETPAPLVTPQIISRSPVSSPIDPDRTIAYETIPYSMVMTTPPPKGYVKKGQSCLLVSSLLLVQAEHVEPPSTSVISISSSPSFFFGVTRSPGSLGPRFFPMWTWAPFISLPCPLLHTDGAPLLQLINAIYSVLR